MEKKSFHNKFPYDLFSFIQFLRLIMKTISHVFVIAPICPIIMWATLLNPQNIYETWK
jgi:hypothetical protein